MTRSLRQTVRIRVSIYSVPDPGWLNYEDTPGNFLLVPPGNDVNGLGTGASDFIGVYTSVAPSQFTGAETCEVQPVPDVQASPQGMVDWMRRRHWTTE